MATIGPPHLGQNQRSLAVAMEASCLACGCGAEPSKLKTEWQGRGTPAMGQEAEMPDAHETFREDVQQEATQELIKR